MLDNSRIRRLALWWSAGNALGVAVSIAIEEHIFYQHVRAGEYRPPLAAHTPYIVVWLAFMIMLGVLQALTCCWLISFMKIRNNILRVTLGLAQGILAAIVIPVLGVLFVVYVFPFPGYLDEYHYGTEALIGIYPFLFSGIIFGSLASAFPDFCNEIEEIVAERNRAVARLTYTGTHRGEIFGVAPTRKKVSYAGAAFFRIENGQVAQGWVLGDLAGLLGQLGARRLP